LPGRTPREAVEYFLTPLRETISCVTDAHVGVSRGGHDTLGRFHSLVVNRDHSMKLPGSQLLLSLRMIYEIIECEDQRRGRYRVSTRAYDYRLRTLTGDVVVMWHWHPGSRIGWPHLHLGSSQVSLDGVLDHHSHLATGRTSVESIVRSCITEWGAPAKHDDWEERLDRREEDFTQHRSWH
jgi:hypothetical protein